MGRVREIRRLRRRVRIGAPDPSLTRFAGMVAVTELVDRLAMIRLLDAAIGPIKVRDRGFTGGELLVGMACAQLAGEAPPRHRHWRSLEAGGRRSESRGRPGRGRSPSPSVADRRGASRDTA